MEPGGDRGERDEGGGSGISRRHFVAGGLFSIAGTSQFVSGGTRSEFSSSATAEGTVGVATLNRSIADYSSESDNVRYEIGYQVLMDSGFQSIDITVENQTDGATWSYNRTDREGVVIHDQGKKGNYGYDDQYQITFDVNIGSSSNPVMTETVTDLADGTNPENNDDLSSPNSPEIKWLVIDDSSHNDTGVSYDVYYDVTNQSRFGEMRITFQDNDGSWATRTVSNASEPIATLSHTEGNYGHSFDILAQVKNDDGLTVDEVTISDIADGTDPTGYGDPALADSPQLDSFTVTDNSSSGSTELVVDYSVSNTSRWAGVNIYFDNQTEEWADSELDDRSSPYEPITYSDRGTNGDEYHVTVEVLESREGMTFAVDAGTVAHVANGPENQTSWPEDSL